MRQLPLYPAPIYQSTYLHATMAAPPSNAPHDDRDQDNQPEYPTPSLALGPTHPYQPEAAQARHRQQAGTICGMSYRYRNPHYKKYHPETLDREDSTPRPTARRRNMTFRWVAREEGRAEVRAGGPWRERQRRGRHSRGHGGTLPRGRR